MSYYEEIKESDKNYIIRIEGIKVGKDKIKIDANEDCINLRIGDEVMHYDTPKIDPLKLNAKFDEGVLTINAELKKAKEDNGIEIPVKDLKEEYTNEIKNKLIRLQADFENYIKRTDKEKEELRKYANEKLVEKLLPVLDAFEIALNLPDAKKDNKFYDGMRMVYENLRKILEEENLKEINPVGKKFDPYYHEALYQEETDEYPEGTVIEELQKGYILNSKVIRTSKVKLAKKKSDADSSNS